MVTVQSFIGLVSNCKALRLQRALSVYTTMAHKSRVFHFWRKLYHMRLHEKHSLLLVFRGLYQQNVFRCFRTWRIHTTVFSSLLRRNAANHAWHKWKLALAARRQYKGTLLRRVLTAWRVYFQSIDAAKLLLIKRRRTLWHILIRSAQRMFQVQSDSPFIVTDLFLLRTGK